jgi:PAS domain S-box-containing protein
MKDTLATLFAFVVAAFTAYWITAFGAPVSRDTIATLFIDGMPWMNALRALTFLALWFILWRQPTDTTLGRWTNALFFFTFLLSVQVAYLASYLTANADASDVEGPAEWSLIVGMNVFPLITSIIAIGVVIQTIRATTFLVSHEGVFGTLAQALPIIVADHTGVIRHTTDELDDLVGAAPGELIGQHLDVIMPERYRANHHYGFDRYVQTRESHIVGTVVPVDLLRLDGTEIPVYLALNVAEVDGKPWPVASMWPAPDPLSDREAIIEEREQLQDETALLQAETTLKNTERGLRYTEAGVQLDLDRTTQHDRRDAMDVERKAFDAEKDGQP